MVPDGVHAPPPELELTTTELLEPLEDDAATEELLTLLEDDATTEELLAPLEDDNATEELLTLLEDDTAAEELLIPLEDDTAAEELLISLDDISTELLETVSESLDGAMLSSSFLFELQLTASNIENAAAKNKFFDAVFIENLQFIKHY